MTPARTTPDLSSLRKALFAECRRAGMDDTMRHDWLLATCGKSSTKDMTARDFARCLDALKRGSKSTFKASTKPQVRKIYAMWKALGDAGKLDNPFKPALRAWIHRMTGVDDPEWLDPGQAHQVIESLKSWEAR